MAEAIARTLRDGPRYDVEYRVVRPDGEVRVVHSLGDVTLDASGRPRHMFGMVQDVTERKRVEDALRDSETFLRLSQEASGVGSWEWDLTTGRVRWSESMCRIHGLTAHEFDGRLETAASFFHPDDVPGLHASMRRVMEQGVATHMEYRIRWRNGVERTVRCKGEVVLDRFGKAARYIGTITDVTERLKLEEQLRQAQKMEAIGQLAGGVAHDFNNLLTVINGFSELLLADLPAADPRREPMTAIRDAGEQAARVTGQLLAFSRKAIVAPKVLDLNELIDSTGKMLRRLIGEDVTLTTVLSPGLSRVRIDPVQVEQVLMNLAVNARDAMLRGGQLTIETTNVEMGEGDIPGRPDLKPGRQVRLSVADTGHGMTDEVKARLFEPFFTTKGVGKGTGLGLATVYGIVKQAGGDVTVHTRVGAGTTFTIFLPAVPETAKPVESGALRLAPRGAETVLLTEDAEAVRKLVRRALEMQGYTVLEAGTGADAERAVDAHPGPVHLLVTDVVMPDLNGRELADAIRARRPGVKVLYISGYTDDAVVRHGVSEAADAFLQKPFTPLSLARKVREVLDGPP
jgi:PAS domain S-box-containing protein